MYTIEQRLDKIETLLNQILTKLDYTMPYRDRYPDYYPYNLPPAYPWHHRSNIICKSDNIYE